MLRRAFAYVSTTVVGGDEETASDELYRMAARRCGGADGLRALEISRERTRLGDLIAGTFVRVWEEQQSAEDAAS